jgi:hypothetical protein
MCMRRRRKQAPQVDWPADQRCGIDIQASLDAIGAGKTNKNVKNIKESDKNQHGVVTVLGAIKSLNMSNDMPST